MEEPATPDTGPEQTEEDDRGDGISRRTLLLLAGLTGGAAGVGIYTLWGDGDEAVVTADNDADEHIPFDVWEEIQTALRTSPDHFPGRAARLVREGDPEAMFAFVRDRIATIPARDWNMGRFGSLTSGARWGIRGTLRCGAGTPREKAELLASMYQRAGYDAAVLQGGPGLDKERARSLVLRALDRQFAPAIDEEQIRDWQRRLGIDAGSETSADALETDSHSAQQLAAQIAAALPTDRGKPSAFDWRSDGSAPVVRVETDSGPRFANLFLDVPFGEPGADPRRLEPIGPMDESREVEVTLSASTADAPDEPFELASGRWSVRDLVGRQLYVHTLPGVQPLDNPGVRFSDIRTFLPAFVVQGAGTSPEKLGELAVMGEPFTVRGDRLELNDDGTLTGEDSVLAIDPEADPASVASLEAEVDAGHFPAVRLFVHALDADGAPVEGLPGSAFAVSDSGHDVVPTLISNNAAPRVRVLYDTSLSMPGRYSGDRMREFVDRLREDILAIAPDARIAMTSTSSKLWRYLADAAAGTDNLIVYATDGDVADERTPEIERALRGGPRAVILDVNSATDEEIDSEDMLQMAELTDGVVLPASNQDATRQALTGYLAEVIEKLPTCVFAYGAPGDGDSHHVTEVRVPAAAAVAEAEYDAPARGLRPPELAGLYLTVTLRQSGGDPHVTRTLAGWDPVRDHRQAGTWEHVLDVAGALFGATVLSFEGTGVPFSVWADDVLESRLSFRDLDRAVTRGTVQEARAELDEGLLGLAVEPLVLSMPLPDAMTERTHTFPDTVRMTLYHEQPAFGTNRVRKHVDVLPLTQFVTASDSAERSFRATLAATAGIADLEQALFEETTASLLQGATLATELADDVDRDRVEEFDRLVDRFDGPGREVRLLPANGDALAYWSVDFRSGQLCGVLADGSGGGNAEAEIREAIARLDRAISLYNLYMTAAGSAGMVGPLGSFSLGIVALYGQMLARLYGAVSLALTIMDTSNLDLSQRKALANLACESAKSIFIAGVSSKEVAGGRIASRTGLTLTMVGILENLIGMMGGSSPLACNL